MNKNINEAEDQQKEESKMLLALKKRRSRAYLIDFNGPFMCFLLFAMFYTPGEGSPDYIGLIMHIGVVAVPVLLCIFRDVFGRSFGKYICRLKIIPLVEYENLTFAQLIFRNIIYFPYPDLITIPREGLRLGDKIAKTKVVFEDENWEENQEERFSKYIRFAMKTRGFK